MQKGAMINVVKILFSSKCGSIKTLVTSWCFIPHPIPHGYNWRMIHDPFVHLSVTQLRSAYEGDYEAISHALYIFNLSKADISGSSKDSENKVLRDDNPLVRHRGSVPLRPWPLYSHLYSTDPAKKYSLVGSETHLRLRTPRIECHCLFS